MKNIIKNYPNVSNAFFSLTDAVTDASDFDKKTKELILIGMFTMNGGIGGLRTHSQRFIEAGGTLNEALGCILLALPVVGITRVNQSFNAILNLAKELSL
ncbi:carboxymuconolactone decarboxylase family protein [Lactiplantibacillus plantarum]